MRVLNIALLYLFLLLVLQIHAISGTRFLHQDIKLVTKELRLQSLQKGTIPPSEGSSCTNIPGSGGPPCPLKEMHYAATAALPHPMLQFGVATNHK
ncbi:hypothetical protein HRI_003863500 [Hibiscus trionum]|uniref:Uncharacterized protein n=1 Tax=Hibiscus trionum TaxID=183268 RepID=A0A9W7MFB9_HIBTR|nr:hypothetical protein HRI_003863500 [Hibiscus trionum]